jgi:hypothetical protein
MTIADNLPRETKKFAVTDIAATTQLMRDNLQKHISTSRR